MLTTVYIFFEKYGRIQKLLIFTSNQTNMKLFRLTAFSLATVTAFLFLVSCETDGELKKTTDFSKSDIPMTGAQVITSNTSTALGKLTVFYTRETRILSYSFNWSGLAANPTGIGIYGLAPAGYYVSPTTTAQTISTSGLTTTGSKSGTLLVDGVAIKEQDLLNGLYYLLIRTNNTTYPLGEIRGQIIFQ